MKKVVFLILFVCTLSAQTPYASLEDALRSGAKLSGTGMPQSLNWLDGGKKYTYKAAGGVIKAVEAASGSEETVFDPAQHSFSYESFEFSKDEAYIVFRNNVRPVWRNSGYADYWQYSRKDKKLKEIVKNAYTAEISPDGSRVAYEQDGNMFVTELATGKTKQLTKDARKSFYNGRFGWVYEEEFGLVQAWSWSPDSKQIAYWQTDETQVPIYQYTNYNGFDEKYEAVPYPRVGDTNPSVRIGVVDLKSAKTSWMKVAAPDAYIPRIYWTAQAGQLAIVHLNRKQNHMQLYFADAKSGTAKKVFEETSATWLEVFSFGANIMHFFNFPKEKNEFLWVSERDGYQHIYRYDYTGKLINQVTKGNWEVFKVQQVDYNKGKIYYTSTEVSPLEHHLFEINLDGSEKRQITTAKGHHAIAFGGENFIDSYSNTTLPKQVDLVNISGKMLKKLQANDAVKQYVANHAYAPAELSHFTASDGQKIDISIVKPFNFDASKKYPLYLAVYGGPAHQDVFNKFETSTFHQYLAQLGYVVVQVNNRGSASYGRDFKNIVYGRLGESECKDFAETAKYMVSLGFIDPEKVAIKGHSYGGYASAFSILTYPDVFKTAIIAAPVTDWRLYDSIYTERFMGLEKENEAGYAKSSPSTYAANLKRKILVTHSTSDDNVHVRNSLQFINKAQAAGKDVEQRIYTEGGHGIAHDFSTHILLHSQYVDFLEKNLKN